MRKLLNKPWFAGLLAIAAVAVVARVAFSGGGGLSLGAADAAESAVEGEGVADTSTHAPVEAILKSLPIPAGLRDPFAVRAKTEVGEKLVEPDVVDTVHLSAIWTQDGQTLVLINDRILQGGDEIGRIKIESATPDGVWISHWKGRDFLSIGGNFTLNTPAVRLATLTGSL